MNLFIGVDGNENPSWENYHYVINRNPTSDTKTSLEKSNGGFNFSNVADINYSIQGQIMQICIPRSKLGINKKTFSINFKVADSIEKEDDIMDYYVSGESVPLGRLSYSYSNNYVDILNNSKESFSLFNFILIAFSIAATSVCMVILFGKNSLKSSKGKISDSSKINRG